VAALVFSVYFILLLTTRHDAFLTNAEDLGIYDQAIWNTLHGHVLHQTICNIVSDTNCVSPAGIMRFAIHFEPILFPISLLYTLWSTPKTLLIVQTLVVASGAFPAFWLARLRLRNDLVAVMFALLYLLYPAQQQALVSDFHAVTLTAALLLFTLYCMYTRRTLWLFVFALLSMACKEEIPLVIIMFGLWSILFQRRWRSGLALVALALCWFALVTYVVTPHFSPTGHPLLFSRYSQLGTPRLFVRGLIHHSDLFLNQYVWEPAHLAYLNILFAPAAYLPLLAPWMLILALPSLAANLLSSDVQMYSGLFHYNAEIVPVLIFAAIEALVLIVWLIRMLVQWLSSFSKRAVAAAGQEANGQDARSWTRFIYVALLFVLSGSMLVSALRLDYTFSGQMPYAEGFQWNEVTPHEALAQRIMSLIPPAASVSAQSKLVPHISERESIYLFPYGDTQAQYIFLDVTGDVYPLGYADYVKEVKHVLFSGNYGVVSAEQGYLLLKRGLPAPGVSPASPVQAGAQSDQSQVLPALPESFCSNIYVSENAITHPLTVNFSAPGGGDLDLVGYDVQLAHPASPDQAVGVTSYWRVTGPMNTPLKLLLLMQGSDGKEYPVSADLPTFSWCQSHTWQPGRIIQVKSTLFALRWTQVPDGLAHMSIALLPLIQSSSTIMDVKVRLPLHVVHTPATVTVSQETNALQLMSLTIVR